jgi:hypothetical protein
MCLGDRHCMQREPQKYRAEVGKAHLSGRPVGKSQVGMHGGAWSQSS